MSDNSLIRILKSREAMLPPEVEVRVSQIAAAFAFIGHLSEHFGKSFVNTAARFWGGELSPEPLPDPDPLNDPHAVWRVKPD